MGKGAGSYLLRFQTQNYIQEEKGVEEYRGIYL